MFINHYDVLGVPCDASIKEINSAWKRFALKNYPDKSGGAETTTELFQKVS
jgi:curved DNA-binding protein CbpA